MQRLRLDHGPQRRLLQMPQLRLYERVLVRCGEWLSPTASGRPQGRPFSSVMHDIFFVPQQFATVQEAVDACAGPATIVVTPGVYAESVRVVGKESVVIQSAQLSRRGVCVSGGLSVERSVVHLSGIELRANGRRRGCSVADSTISLQECVIAGNRTSEPFGAGMMCRNSRVRIQKSAIVGNVVDTLAAVAGGGGVYVDTCRVEIAGCTIQANEVYAPDRVRGGGIWCARSTMRVWRSRVTDNAGGGICFEEPLNCQIGGTVVTGNRGGGIVIAGDAARVAIHRNTVVRQNYPADVELDR